LAFSGVAGSRPARGFPIADGDCQCTVKGRRAVVPVVLAGFFVRASPGEACPRSAVSVLI
jgi:hypothetical protein